MIGKGDIKMISDVAPAIMHRRTDSVQAVQTTHYGTVKY